MPFTNAPPAAAQTANDITAEGPCRYQIRSSPSVSVGDLSLIAVSLLLLIKQGVILKGCSSGSSIFLVVVVAFIK